MKKNSLTHSFKVACTGIFEILKMERNFQIELVIGAIAILLCVILKVSKTEWIVVLLCCMVVLSMECINTALEKVIDLVSPKWNELARQGKDFAAGAVLLSAIISFVIGMIIFIPYLISYMGG